MPAEKDPSGEIGKGSDEVLRKPGAIATEQATYELSKATTPVEVAKISQGMSREAFTAAAFAAQNKDAQAQLKHQQLPPTPPSQV